MISKDHPMGCPRCHKPWTRKGEASPRTTHFGVSSDRVLTVCGPCMDSVQATLKDRAEAEGRLPTHFGQSRGLNRP